LKDEITNLSVVVASWNGTASLRQCLESLETQTDRTSDEIIVVSNFAPDIPKNGSGVSFHVRPSSFTVPELRRDGIAAARGSVVALIEDHCTVDAKWITEIKRAHISDAAAIGGAVENKGEGNALDWAVYFYDYGKFMPPNSAGVTETLSGLNTSYKREALDEIHDDYQNGFFETFANEALKRRGHQLSMRPSAVVFHNKRYELRSALSHCYHLARSYAAQRVADASFGKRSIFILGSLFLPILLPARVVLSVIRKGRNRGHLLRALPFLILLMSAWSYGELCGYSAGEGESRARWR
jgi:glycosyltransferase involved in cell wall biosynthesis